MSRKNDGITKTEPFPEEHAAKELSGATDEDPVWVEAMTETGVPYYFHMYSGGRLFCAQNLDNSCFSMKFLSALIRHSFILLKKLRVLETSWQAPSRYFTSEQYALKYAALTGDSSHFQPTIPG